MGGTRILARLCALGVLFAAAVLCSAPCSADEPSKEDREAVERAFLEGRPQYLEALLGQPGRDAAATRRWPLELRDRWWRGPPVSEGEPPHRLRSDGGEDPYPVLTALVEDRQRREQRGHAGLPEESPLVLLAESYDPQTHEALHYYLGANTRHWMERAYVGYPEDDLSRRTERNSARLSARNGSLAAWSLILFVLGAIGLGLYLGRGAGRS